MSAIKLSTRGSQHAARRQYKAAAYWNQPYAFTKVNHKRNKNKGCRSQESEIYDDMTASSDTFRWYIGRLLQIDRPNASFEDLKADVDSIEAHIFDNSETGLVDIADVEDAVRKWRTNYLESRTNKPDSKTMSSARAACMALYLEKYLERWRNLGTSYLKALLFFSSARLAHDTLSGKQSTTWISPVGKALFACGQNNTTQYFSNVFILIYVIHKVQSARKDLQDLDWLAEARCETYQSHHKSVQPNLYHEDATQSLYRLILETVGLELPQVIEYFGKFPSKELAKLEFRHTLRNIERSKQKKRYTKQPRKQEMPNRRSTPEQQADEVQSFLRMKKSAIPTGKCGRESILPWLQPRKKRKPCRKCPARKIFPPPDIDDLECIDSGFDGDDSYSAVGSPNVDTDIPSGYETFLNWDIGARWVDRFEQHNIPTDPETLLDNADPSDVNPEFPSTHSCKAGYSKATKKVLRIPKLARQQKRSKRTRSYGPEEYLELDDFDDSEPEAVSPTFDSSPCTNYEPRVANVRLLLIEEYAGFSSDHLLPNGIVLDEKWSIKGFLRHDTHADVYAVRDLCDSEPGRSIGFAEAHVFLETIGKWGMYAKRRKKAMKQKKRGEIVIGECWLREHEPVFGHSSFSTDRKRSSKLARSDKSTWDDLVKPGYVNEWHVLIVGASTTNGTAKSYVQGSHAPKSKLPAQVHRASVPPFTSADQEPEGNPHSEAEVESGLAHSQTNLSARLLPISSKENDMKSLHKPKRKHQPSIVVSNRDKYLSCVINVHVSESFWHFKSGIPYKTQLLDDIAQLFRYARRLEGTPSEHDIFMLPVMPTLDDGTELSVKSKDNMFRRDLMRFVLDQLGDWDLTSPKTADMLKDMAFVVDLARTQRPGWGKAVFEGIKAHYRDQVRIEP